MFTHQRYQVVMFYLVMFTYTVVLVRLTPYYHMSSNILEIASNVSFHL